MIKYKLTDENLRTYGGCQWGEGVTHTASGEGELCGPGWIHVYDSPELAVLLNPMHANFKNPVLWKVRVSGLAKHDRGLISGYTKVTSLRRMELTTVSREQRVKFAILCAPLVYKDKQFKSWATAWISGKERSARSAAAAVAPRAAAADASGYDARAAAADAAAYAARAAASYAARAAAADAAAATYAAAAISAAAYAARADSASENKNLNLKRLAKMALSGR